MSDSATAVSIVLFFFFNDTATTEIYTLSLHDALPIYTLSLHDALRPQVRYPRDHVLRSEEHTSELQSRVDLVCRLLLEKKKHMDASDPEVEDKLRAEVAPAPARML